ncbi:Nucleoid-associated protein Lsr2 (plasmid) [Streptomyces sp. YIM 121038]|uniref:histone-like nucleoid-structuring protein Lsr2 n=1 Tax=Streptomyces sp. YIM 121038 TaxID=2136401 RepID=UPI001110B02B|nr:Lsr2 family protein [Streptomyces sp. YIM 121038]QCX82471.1 Nucleoid-associated protein Lsr2 [Streptomyces sp. YIM 121038]
MAQKTIVITTDDLTGETSEEVSAHTFSLNGVTYEIDLTPENYDKLDAALRPFIEKGRKMGRVKKGTRARKTDISGPKPEEVRAWARGKGFEVNDRGRVSAQVMEAFEAAH